VNELDTLGVDNILALRGDPPKIAPDLDPRKGEFPFARDLVAFLKGTGTFSLGVAVNPEGHPRSPSLRKDMEYTKQKIDAGADFAITQMFFENDHYYRFLERAERSGIAIPIIPGIMPIVDCGRIKEMASLCGATIPQPVLDRIEPLADLPEETRKHGVEHAVKQVEDLLAHGVRYLHFYTMNRPESVLEILSAVRGLVRCVPAAA
jgi:methylenetetrahydrofolate reductase (NADPH)